MKERTTVALNRALLAACLIATAVESKDDYVVLVDAGADEAYLPAAKAMAKLHKGVVLPFDPAKLNAALRSLRSRQPRFVVFVLPPQEIDVDLCHAILDMATKVDEDPFVDFEYGFVTGRDGDAALRFVSRVKKAWKRRFGRKGAMFGSWEGPYLPTGQPLSATKALGFDFVQRYVKARDAENVRKKAAREALASFSGRDVMLFYSHGYPNEMAACFRAGDLRSWNIRFGPAILFNCACYNGAPGRWYRVGRDGKFEDRGVVAPEQSVALALLDSGIAGYIAGVDPWHGPLTNQVFLYVVDDGMRLGQAAKIMQDRLALAFLPDRIHFPPTREVTFTGEGTANRRRNGAGMILYGDPALAPFSTRARRFFSADLKAVSKGKMKVMISGRPLIPGTPGADAILLQARLMDYYSVKTSNLAEELKMEVYRVLSLRKAPKRPPRFRVVSARSGSMQLETGTPQAAVEETPKGPYLHLRVPIDEKLFPPVKLMHLARTGFRIDLESGE